VSDDIKALFGDSDDGEVVVPATTDEQVALMASFETAHCEESTRQFMAAEREALAAMLVVRANAAREATRVAAEEEAARVAACAAEAALDLATREEAAIAEEVAYEAARAVARAEEQAVEAAAEAAAQEEIARDRRRWDEDMAAARRLREVHELVTHRRHRWNLARHQAQRSHQAGDKGSNTVDLGWNDDLL
jgi:peroxiredoxin